MLLYKYTNISIVMIILIMVIHIVILNYVNKMLLDYINIEEKISPFNEIH
jgi:hypothetical protein